MNNLVGLTLFAIGIVLLILGFNASQSFSSDVSRLFTGNPTDRSIWLLLGGTVAVAAGLLLSIRGVRRG
jgi:multisubunit Na+/H+ antiporter MnhB subunit